MGDERFTSAEQIEAEIDNIKARAAYQLRCAESYEMDIRAVQMRNNRAEDWIIEEKTKMAKDARRLATHLLEVRCRSLSEKLAVIRTPQLPGVDNGDSSIPKRLAPRK